MVQSVAGRLWAESWVAIHSCIAAPQQGSLHSVCCWRGQGWNVLDCTILDKHCAECGSRTVGYILGGCIVAPWYTMYIIEGVCEHLQRNFSSRALVARYGMLVLHVGI